MKQLPILLVLALLHTSCAGVIITPLEQSRTTGQNPRMKAGETISLGSGQNYPFITAIGGGATVTVMPPTGNTAVVINPDGSHSIAIIDGSTATIITP